MVVTDIYMYLLFYAVSLLRSLTILYYVLQRKCKEREIRKRSKSIFPRWLTMIALLLIHTCEKRTQILAEEDENVFIT